MKPKDLIHHVYLSALGISIEIAYSFAIILTSLIIIYFISLLKWSSNQP